MATTDPITLRQRILDTARALLEADGLAALSLREVARRAGVTHQAPYHHFGDRESILAELVVEGFDELARRLEVAITAGGPRRAVMVAAFDAYVGFAIDHPGVFRIMFRPELCDAQRFQAARDAGERAHAQLRRMVEVLHGPDRDGTLASTYWSQVHGLACLLVDGPLGQALPDPPARRAHMQAVGARLADMLRLPG